MYGKSIEEIMVKRWYFGMVFVFVFATFYPSIHVYLFFEHADLWDNYKIDAYFRPTESAGFFVFLYAICPFLRQGMLEGDKLLPFFALWFILLQVSLLFGLFSAGDIGFHDTVGDKAATSVIISQFSAIVLAWVLAPKGWGDRNNYNYDFD